MNNYNFNDINFKKSDIYKQFILDNPSFGNLKIRTYSFSEAIPVPNVKIVVYKEIDNNNIIFFEGVSDDVGMVEKISLPTPKLESNNLDKPNKSTYKILALYDGDSFNYDVNMYEDICVLQRINIVPNKDMAGEY